MSFDLDALKKEIKDEIMAEVREMLGVQTIAKKKQRSLSEPVKDIPLEAKQYIFDNFDVEDEIDFAIYLFKVIFVNGYDRWPIRKIGRSRIQFYADGEWKDDSSTGNEDLKMMISEALIVGYRKCIAGDFRKAMVEKIGKPACRIRWSRLRTYMINLDNKKTINAIFSRLKNRIPQI